MKALYWFGWIVARIVGRVLGNWEITGAENVPQKGGFIFAPNHISYLDPPIVGASIRRRVHFMAKEELFKPPVFGKLISFVGAFPVKRGTADRNAIRKALELLEKGEGVTIFPEGTRSEDGNLKDPEIGIGMIALKSKAPVVPAAIIGTDKVLGKGARLPRFAKIKVRVGKPMSFPDLYSEKPEREAMEEVGRRVMDEIRRLREEALNGSC